jgi:hypothetical protein
MRIAGASKRADLLMVKWAFSHDRNGGIILPTDRNSQLIAEWRTGEVPMNTKAKTKAQKADVDANLDEALDESFPAALDDPASDGSGRDPEKTEETPEGRSDPPPDKAEPRESNGTVAFTAW